MALPSSVSHFDIEGHGPGKSGKSPGEVLERSGYFVWLIVWGTTRESSGEKSSRNT